MQYVLHAESMSEQAREALQVTVEHWNNPPAQITPPKERSGCIGYFLEKIGIKKEIITS